MSKHREYTPKDVKQMLRQGRKLDSRIKMLEESRERAFAKVTSATQQLSVTGVHSDTQTDAMSEYVAYSEEILAEIAKMERVQKVTLALISKVEQSDLQNVLHLYYLDCMTWEEVAVKLNYSWRWVMELHGRALIEAAKAANRNRRLIEELVAK